MHVWINRAGPSRVHLMRMLRDNPDDHPVTIRATRPGGQGIALQAADSSGDEPDWDATDDEYADWALAQVRFHGINVLLPTCRMTALAARSIDFWAEGCIVVAAATEQAAKVTASKSATYRAARAAGVPTPPYYRVETADALWNAVLDLRRAGFVPCVKPDGGFSVSGFRILAEGEPSFADFLTNPGPKVRAESYVYAMARAELEGLDIEPMIVMPVLSEPETSVDCLTLPNGEVITVGREKRGWERVFVEDPERIGERMVKHLGLAYLSNVQTRMLGDKPVLLEVNARPSAGVYQTAATGTNLVWAAVSTAMYTSPGKVMFPTLGGSVVTGDAVLTA